MLDKGILRYKYNTTEPDYKTFEQFAHRGLNKNECQVLNGSWLALIALTWFLWQIHFMKVATNFYTTRVAIYQTKP